MVAEHQRDYNDEAYSQSVQRLSGRANGQRLSSRANGLREAQKNHSQVLSKLGAGTFAEELNKLMCRYTDGAVCSGEEENTYVIDTMPNYKYNFSLHEH
jgi:hypothetical protein